MSRLINGGESDFITERLVIFAKEDIEMQIQMF